MLRWFLPFDAFFSIETQNCFCEEQALFFLQSISAGIFFWDHADVIFAKFGFHIRASRISSSIVFWVFRSSRHVSNFDFEISFRIDGLCVRKGILGICFEACWLSVVSFCGMFSQECPKCIETVWNKMLTMFSKLIGFIFPLYVEWLFCYVICPELSLLLRGCFAEFLCWYELFMNLRPGVHKVKLAKSLTHKLYKTVALPYGSRNAHSHHKGKSRLKHWGKQDKTFKLKNPMCKLILAVLRRQHVECLQLRTCTNIGTAHFVTFSHMLRPIVGTPGYRMSMPSQSSTSWSSQARFNGFTVLPSVHFFDGQTAEEKLLRSQWISYLKYNTFTLRYGYGNLI